MATISTGTGDDGTTGLFLGGRVSKAESQVEAAGDLDETVAVLGVARAACAGGATVPFGDTDDGGAELASLLLRLQRELFVCGADLSTNPFHRDRLVPGTSLVTSQMVADLEALMADLVERRPLRPVFIVPGSNPVGASLDHARTVARRAERHVVAARASGVEVNPQLSTYLNRFSDLLFVLARHAGGPDEPASHD
ncbi:cob(I)yrinic acid a,c-diamide adenosyltransferase [Occultella glacieicola]|uniref:Corrinoid adenosyltransferase n=1 Tax=Occultella glacieicola TaxID=2518684 RepID=A0ABY2E664_9MICO|nr:cob(I)yrinic acid a,c-diamide adenosyltransferase [Occultella glacieicola]TDE95959.1 cob(I)yrinic acid a,c-diamide adenosyltransferase [Occultella glacieicola]